MAAPTNVWKFKFDLWGDRVPKIVSLEATASLETLEGTLLFMSSGRVDNAGNSASTLLGLAAEATSAAFSSAEVFDFDFLFLAAFLSGINIKRARF